MRVEIDPGAIVIRFSPFTPETLLKRARYDAIRTGGVHGCSVWADVQRGDESPADTITRLLAVSETAGLAADRNGNYMRCTRAGELLALGFTFVKDEYDGEHLEHYSVDLGDDPSQDDAARFLSVFERVKR